MFTGLIEDVGRVVSLRRRSNGAVLDVRTDLTGLVTGESIAVNGVCQTVTRFAGGVFTCEVLPETMRATNIAGLRGGHRVNLERALRPGDRLGGHFVNGHVDGTGEVKAIRRDPLSIDIAVGAGIFSHIVPKGSIAIDGVSLTVGPDPRGGVFRVFIIPHTWEHTGLGKLRIGSRVNIETDILAKYVFKLFGRDPAARIFEDGGSGEDG